VAVDAAGRGRRTLPYLPALDGLRGLAVAAVLLFHGQVGFLRGGHLGVTVFFTLSGFLITSLLLLERTRHGRVDLPRFWVRRARRLVPAMLLCLPLAALVVHESPGPVGSGVLGDAVASLGWVANWRFILHHQTYADLFALPSPFQHFWSLGVEEQFYVAFPLLFVLVLKRGVAQRHRGALAALLGVLIVGSTLELARLNATGGAFSRAYYGTDARIAELLVGALLAVALVKAEGLRSLNRPVVSGAGLLGLAGLGVAFTVLDTGNPLLYRGGFLAVAVCAALVIAAAVQPGSPVARVLAFPPLVQLGVISYGVYLFHWPLFLLLTAETTGLSGPSLLLLRLVLTVGLAVLSYVMIERPARFGSLSPAQGFGGWAGGAVAGVLAVALATGAVPLPTPHPTGQTPTTAGGLPVVGAPPSRLPTSSRAASPHGKPLAGSTRQSAAVSSPLGKPSPSKVPVTVKSRATVPSEFFQSPSNTKVPPVPPVPPGALKVVVVGDSIGNNLGRGLISWAQGRSDVVVYNLSVPACPFSRGRERRLSPEKEFDVDPVCAWWDDASTQRRQAFEQFDPDIVVTQDAINEVFDRRLPQWGGWRSPGQPQFDSWLGNEYQTVFGQWTSAGAKVIVTNAPCGDWTRSFQDVQNPQLRISDLNVTYNRLPGVTSANFFQRVCPNGQYSDTVEGVPNARPDGFHFTDEAAAALATNWLGPLILQTAQQGAGPLKP
jgi:peptidoglycan/LPS O-acetylase OafA/YrhL